MAELKNILCFLSFVLAYFGSIQAQIQRCVPGIVPNVSITSNNVIQWSKANNPDNCTINAYIIDIFDYDGGSQLQVELNSSLFQYSLSNLDLCTTYLFEVHALTNQYVLGPAESINATTNPPANLNLTLNINNAVLKNDQISLTWNPARTGISRCISYYRVIYWDENNSPIDTYVPTNNFVSTGNLVSCMKYTFQISAIINNPDTEGPLSEISWSGYSAVPNPPQLINIVTSDTTVNMTWSVVSYSENRCSLKALVVNTLGLPTNTSTSTITIADSVLRPDVDVFLQNLTPNTIYTSLVSLQNTAGYSRNVSVMFQTSDYFVFNYENDIFYY